MNARPRISPLACLLALAGASCLYAGGNDWFVAYQTRATMVAGEASLRALDLQVTSGQKIVAVGIAFWVSAGLIQWLANFRRGHEVRRVEVQVTREIRTQFTTFFAGFGALVTFAAAVLLDCAENSCLLLALLGTLLGALLGYLATPSLVVSEARNPSGFRWS